MSKAEAAGNISCLTKSSIVVPKVPDLSASTTSPYLLYIKTIIPATYTRTDLRLVPRNSCHLEDTALRSMPDLDTVAGQEARLPFPPVSKKHILNCSYESWYKQFVLLFRGRVSWLTLSQIPHLYSPFTHNSSYPIISGLSTGGRTLAPRRHTLRGD